MKRMVVAPHADDEVMGCGGLIAKYPGECVVVVCAAPDDERNGEFYAARERLGYTAYAVLGMADGRLGDDMAGLVSSLDEVFARYMPDEVYLPYPGTHQDHVAVFEGGVRACRQSLNPMHYAPPTVLVYETPTYDLEVRANGLQYSVFESLTHDHVETKRFAMEAYDSQVRKPHAGSPDELVSRARSLGLARGVGFAEQFAPMRIVR